MPLDNIDLEAKAALALVLGHIAIFDVCVKPTKEPLPISSASRGP